jgi:hypothetical protein
VTNSTICPFIIPLMFLRLSSGLDVIVGAAGLSPENAFGTKVFFFLVYEISHTSGHVSNLTAFGCPHHNLHIWMNFNANFLLSPHISLTQFLFWQLLTHEHSTWLQLSVTICLDARVVSVHVHPTHFTAPVNFMGLHKI